MRHRNRNVPLVPVGLKTGGKWNEVWTYADFGVFCSLFNDKVADSLGLDLFRGERVTAVVGNGSFTPLYLHNNRYQITDNN